jgi:hypothetical protein
MRAEGERVSAHQVRSDGRCSHRCSDAGIPPAGRGSSAAVPNAARLHRGRQRLIPSPSQAAPARARSPGPKQSADRTSQLRADPGRADRRQGLAEARHARRGRAEIQGVAREPRQLRKYERGEQTVDDKKSRTNMVFATIAAMMPELYAKNPTIAVTPDRRGDRPGDGQGQAFCATAEKVIRKMLVEEGKLKKRAKANIRAACARATAC